MKRMRIALAIMLLVVAATAIVPAARAADISTSVTSKVIAVSVDTSSVDFGVVNAGGNSQSATITATNLGNVVETFTAQCAGTANRVGGGGSWTLATPQGFGPGTDIFAMGLWDGNGTDLTGGATNAFVTGVAASGTQPFSLGFTAPTVVTNGGQYSWSVTIMATE